MESDRSLFFFWLGEEAQEDDMALHYIEPESPEILLRGCEQGGRTAPTVRVAEPVPAG